MHSNICDQTYLPRKPDHKITRPLSRGLHRKHETILHWRHHYHPLSKSLEITSSDEDRKKYVAHRNIYNKLKRQLKTEYYQAKCESFKDNSKKLWALINNTILKVKHRGSIIRHITVDGVKQYRPKAIANSFWRILLNIRWITSEKNCSWHDECKQISTEHTISMR